MPRPKSPLSIDSMILARIKRRGAGTVVVPGDFLDLGSREAIGVALQRMEKSGAIRRLARGVYDLPVTDELLGTLFVRKLGRRKDESYTTY